jgi:hypothetical protein
LEHEEKEGEMGRRRGMNVDGKGLLWGGKERQGGDDD